MQENKFFRAGSGVVIFFAMLSMAASCGEYYTPEAFDPGVKNTTLAAPDITAVSNGDGSRTILSWPVIFGAGGFKMSLYDISDEANPVTIVKDTVIDGSKVELPRTDDTNYRLIVQTLGNEKYNNSPSAETEFLFSSLVPKINGSPLPAGTDLAGYLSSQQGAIDAMTEEFAVELTSGETYVMNGTFNFGQHPFTLRSSRKGVPAIIEFGETAGFVTETGLKLKNVFIKAEGMTGKDKAVISYAKTPTKEKESNYFMIEKTMPVVLQDVRISGLKCNLFYDNGQPWCVFTQLVKNCVIELDQVAMDGNGPSHIFNNAKGFCFDLEVVNSTVYSINQSSKSLLVTYAGVRPTQIAGGAISPTNDIKILRSTFKQVSYKTNWTNIGRLGGQSMYHLTVDRCIFNDCANNAVARYLYANSNDNITWSVTDNNYWYDGAMGDTGRSKGTRVEGDPQLVQHADGYFIVNGPEVKAAGLGDPRGLQ